MKYKVGQYLGGDGLVAQRVVAAIDGDMPLYGLYNPKTNHVNWESEFECIEMQEYKLLDINFDIWKSVQAGDFVTNVGSENGIRKILARVDEAVLLSGTPATPKQLKTGDKVISALEELSEDEDLEEVADNIKEVAGQGKKLRKAVTSQGAQKVAGEWYALSELPLMNWKLVKEE